MIVGNIRMFAIKNEECKFWDENCKIFRIDLRLATLYSSWNRAFFVKRVNKLKSSKVVELRIDEVEKNG